MWCRARLPAGSNVLMLDDVRAYYFPRAVWGNPFYQWPIEVRWDEPAVQRYRALRRRRLVYMVVNANPAFVRRTPTGVDWDQLAEDARTNYIAPLYRSGDVTVYVLRSDR
jgi:hypothetical protein